MGGRRAMGHPSVLVSPRRTKGPVLIDSTIVKAHPHAAGASKARGGQDAQALGRSRGGFTTKVHALVTACGGLVRFVLTGGQTSDVTQAIPIVDRRHGSALVGDRAYDSDAFVAHGKALGMRAVIPSRRHRRKQRRLDRATYAERNVIERWFGRMKTFRRIATRFDKTSSSYAGFVATAAMLVAISGWRG
jgi:transposase